MAKTIIHFGPPKTGTSAIQKWLLENRDTLKSKRIFYPEHVLDKNGISSGNVASVFPNPKVDKLKQARPNKLRLKELCRENKCNTLLLSSEIFMRKLPELATLFPNAVFIGYIRPTFELLESDYNQVVKRHGETKPFSENNRSAMWQLEMLESVIPTIGKERFKLRAYSKSAFYNNDLVKDFLSNLDPELATGADVNSSREINPSYTLEALETKRWLNQFNIERPIQQKLDKHLQGLSMGTQKYSLLPEKEFIKQKADSIKALSEFNTKFHIEGFEKLIADITEKKQKPFNDQVISDDVFESIIRSFMEALPECIEQFRCIAVDKDNDIRNPERKDIIKQLLPS